MHTQHAVYVLFQLEAIEKLSLEQLEKILSFMSALQNEDGSFSTDEYGESDTRFSYCAVATFKLSYLYRRKATENEEEHTKGTSTFNEFCSKRNLNLSKAIDFVSKCQNFDGGFGGIPGAESHAAYTWTCVAFLKLADSLNK